MHPIRRFKTGELFSEDEMFWNPPTLYHYTNREGLVGILNSGAVWATGIRFLNDTSEYSYARSTFVQKLREILQRIEHYHDAKPWHLKELREAIRRLSRLRPNIFVFSLSRNGDQLSQWRAYGQPGNGYSIGFDAPALDEIIRGKEGMQLAAVSYDPRQQWDLMNRIEIEAVRKANSRKGQDAHGFGSELCSIFLDVGPIMKHPAFVEESEWRLVVHQKSAKSAEVHHRVGRSMLIPYVAVDLNAKGHPPPIQHVIIGPHPHPKSEKEAVEGLCRERKLQAEVTNSKIPYRAW